MEEMAGLVEQTIQHFGGLDVLIGNAVRTIACILTQSGPLSCSWSGTFIQHEELENRRLSCS